MNVFIYVCYKNNTGRKTDGGLWQYASMELQFGLAGKATDGGKTYMDCFVNEIEVMLMLLIIIMVKL